MRFPEFKDDWIIKNANDVFTFFPSLPLTWSELNHDGKGIQNIHYGIIHKFDNVIFDASEENIPYIEKQEHVNPSYFVENGDLVFVDASEDLKDSGKSIEVLNINGKITSGLHTIHARDKNKLMMHGFRGHLMNSPTVRRKLQKLSVGTKVYSISKNTFSEIKLNIPSKEEQHKITQILNDLHKLIHTQSEIIDEYKRLQYAFLDKVFKSLNETMTLENLIVFKKKTSRRSDSGFAGGKYPFFTNNITQTKYLDEYDFDGEYIISNTGGYSNFRYYKGRFSVMSDNLVLKVVNINTLYLYYYLRYKNNYINYRGYVGSGLKHLDINWFRKFRIPKHNNSFLIGTFFNEIQNLINIQLELYEAYVKIKNYMINVLFI